MKEQKSRLAMAVNLDKDAYYRRIKRLYGNWKVWPGEIWTPVFRGGRRRLLITTFDGSFEFPERVIRR